MLQKGLVVLISLLLMVMVIGFVSAQEEQVIADAQEGELFNDPEGELLFAADEFSDEELVLEDAGITPDSPFYFVDEFFDRFSKDREEKIAEVQAMIEKGDIEAAREALEQYQAFARDFEEEVRPEEREEARRSAAAIRNALEAIEEDIPEAEKEEFFDDVIEQEVNVVTAVEIATKIKDLCTELATLDPTAFYETCKAGDDSPEWQSELFEDLSSEQEKEARAFFDIMAECFENPEECRCDDISIEAFAAKCSVAAPLAVECEVNGNEDACEELDEITEDMVDLLPPHLLRVIDLLDAMGGDDEHYGGPEECEGITDKLECEEIIFRNDAPEECVDALDAGAFDFVGTGETHEACEQVLFEVHSPEECVEADVSDPEECSALVFSIYAPQECLDAGLTGESHKDNKLCDELMEDLYETEQHNSFGAVCDDISDAEERLACYDAAFGYAQEYEYEVEYEYEHEFEHDGEEEYEYEYEESFEYETDHDEVYDEEEGYEDDEREEEEGDSEDELDDDFDEPEDEENDSEEEAEETTAESDTSDITGNVVSIGSFITGNAFLDYFFD